MRYRKQDVNGDVVFGFGQNDFYKDNVEAVAQAVKTRLLLFVNEYFLDNEEGTLYLEGVLGKHDEETRNTILRQRVINTQGVTNIDSFDSNLDAETRKLSVSIIIDTIYGQSNSIEVTI